MLQSTHRKSATFFAVLSALGLGLGAAAGCGPGDPPGHVEVEDTGSTPQDTGTVEMDTGGGVTDTGQADGPPVVEANTKQLLYEDVSKDAEKTIEVNVRNVGDEAAFVEDVLLSETGERQGPERDEFVLGDGTPDRPFRLPTSVSKTIEVTYKPADFATDQGKLTIQLRHDQDDIVIPIRTINAHADIEAPRRLRIGNVAQGESGDALVNLYNRGLTQLTVREMSLSKDDHFSLRFQGGAGEPFPVSLERGESLDFWVEYSAPDGDERRTTVTVKSDDPDDEEYNINVAANVPGPCLALQTTDLDFGTLSAESEVKQLEMLNCNTTRAVEIESATFSSDGGGVFSVVGPKEEEFPVTIAPGRTEPLKIQATLKEPRKAIGSLIIRANDEEKSPFLVQVRAEKK